MSLLRRGIFLGIPLAELDNDAIVHGQVGDEEVIVARRGTEIFAIGAHCTHYKGPLAQGLIVEDTVRCPCTTRASAFGRVKPSCTRVRHRRLLANRT